MSISFLKKVLTRFKKENRIRSSLGSAQKISKTHSTPNDKKPFFSFFSKMSLARPLPFLRGKKLAREITEESVAQTIEWIMDRTFVPIGVKNIVVEKESQKKMMESFTSHLFRCIDKMNPKGVMDSKKFNYAMEWAKKDSGFEILALRSIKWKE